MQHIIFVNETERLYLSASKASLTTQVMDDLYTRIQNIKKRCDALDAEAHDRLRFADHARWFRSETARRKLNGELFRLYASCHQLSNLIRRADMDRR